jgi:hypothetical protein
VNRKIPARRVVNSRGFCAVSQKGHEHVRVALRNVVLALSVHQLSEKGIFHLGPG